MSYFTTVRCMLWLSYLLCPSVCPSLFLSVPNLCYG